MSNKLQDVALDMKCENQQCNCQTDQKKKPRRTDRQTSDKVIHTGQHNK